MLADFMTTFRGARQITHQDMSLVTSVLAYRDSIDGNNFSSVMYGIPYVLLDNLSLMVLMISTSEAARFRSTGSFKCFKAERL